MGVKDEQSTLRTLIQEAVVMLCRNGVSFQSKLAIEGLLGVTVDDQQVFLINIQHHHETQDSTSGKLSLKRRSSSDKGYPQKQGRFESCLPDQERPQQLQTQMQGTRIMENVNSNDKESDCKTHCVEDVVIIDDGEPNLSRKASRLECPVATKNSASRQCMKKKQVKPKANPDTDISYVSSANTNIIGGSDCSNLPIKQEPIATDNYEMTSVSNAKQGVANALTMQQLKVTNSTTDTQQQHQEYFLSKFHHKFGDLSDMTVSNQATLSPAKGIFPSSYNRNNVDKSLEEDTTDPQVTVSSQGFDNWSSSFSGESFESQMAAIENAMQTAATEVTLLYSGGQAVRAVYHGFLYTKNRSSGNRIYWRCRDRKCHSRMVTIDGQLNGQVTPHECQNYSRQHIMSPLTSSDHLAPIPNSLAMVQPDNTPFPLLEEAEPSPTQAYSEVTSASKSLPEEQFLQ